MVKYTLELNGDKGYVRDETASTLSEAKNKAYAFLSKCDIGSAVVYSGNSIVTTYFKDYFTKKNGSTHEGAVYSIGFNKAYPFTKADTVMEARIKACRILRDYGGIISIVKAVKGGYADVGSIITNGYRFEYSDDEKKKRYTLNPETGRLGKY